MNALPPAPSRWYRRLPATGLRIALAAAMVAAAAAAAAAEAPVPLAATNALPASPPLPDVTFPLLRIAGAFGFVLLLFFGGAWLFRNWPGLSGVRGRSTRLRMLEMRSLGHRHALFVVGYDRQRLLVASSPAGITLLERLPPAEETEELPAETAPASFAEALRRILPNR